MGFFSAALATGAGGGSVDAVGVGVLALGGVGLAVSFSHPTRHAARAAAQKAPIILDVLDMVTSIASTGGRGAQVAGQTLPQATHNLYGE